MKIRLAHNTIQNSSVAVFQANAVTNTDQARAQVLADLTRKARANNLRVDNAALAYQYNWQLRFYGTPDLTKYLANGGYYNLRWTHELEA